MTSVEFLVEKWSEAVPGMRYSPSEGGVLLRVPSPISEVLLSRPCRNKDPFTGTIVINCDFAFSFFVVQVEMYTFSQESCIWPVLCCASTIDRPTCTAFLSLSWHACLVWYEQTDEVVFLSLVRWTLPGICQNTDHAVFRLKSAWKTCFAPCYSYGTAYKWHMVLIRRSPPSDLSSPSSLWDE
jgi:hypothetical protein